MTATETTSKSDLTSNSAAVSYSSEVRQLRDQKTLGELSSHQRLVYALMLRTLTHYRNLMTKKARELLMYSVIATVAGWAVGWVGMLLSYWVLAAVGWLAGGWTNGLLYVLPALMLFVAIVLRIALDEQKIDFQTIRTSEIDRFKLGRLDDILDPIALHILSVVLGMLVGMQAGLLQFRAGHVGIEQAAGGFWSCQMLALDSLGHGALLDVFELYELGLRVDHHVWSASVFLFFRLGMDAVVVLIIYVVYKRFRMRQLFKFFPDEHPSHEPLVNWMQNVCRDHMWIRQFADEFLFVMLVEEFLRGNYDLDREISHQFPKVRVSPEVRKLFDNGAGAVVFEA